MTSPSFTGQRIIGAILFENTMDRDIEKRPTAAYLWNVKQVVPFLKVDKGLAPEKDGVQLMKPMPALAALLDKAKAKGIFGTKMRSLIKQANAAGIKNIVSQQFESAWQIIAAGRLPRKLTFTARKRPKPKSCSRRPSWSTSTNCRRGSWSCSRSRYKSETTSTPIASDIPRS
jgi:hypothetical protein